jgi:hypothetical protein
MAKFTLSFGRPYRYKDTVTVNAARRFGIKKSIHMLRLEEMYCFYLQKNP